MKKKSPDDQLKHWITEKKSCDKQLKTNLSAKDRKRTESVKRFTELGIALSRFSIKLNKEIQRRENKK